jgi:penicillin-binding protein 1A
MTASPPDPPSQPPEEQSGDPGRVPTDPPDGERTRWSAAVLDRVTAFRRSRFWHWARWPAAAALVLLLLGIAGFAYVYSSVELPEEPPVLESSVILDAEGEEIAVLQKDGLRVPVELDEVAPVAVEALIAAEDRRFYDHGGVDPLGMVRAVVSNLRGGTQGGSTITQQLVKNSYLDSERTLTRKVKEAVLSMKLEREADKDEILERYLNTVYFGRGTYGIESAARIYFDTTAADLTLPQAALLVGLLRAPETADPVGNEQEARRRRQTVLDAMAETGAITERRARRVGNRQLGAQPEPSSVTLSAGVAPHFVEWIRAEAIEKFGAETVYGGGLRITTTLDLDDQRAAEAAIETVLDEPDDPQASLVALDREGAVKAYVGGRDFESLQVDLARGEAGGGTGRQPGSTFKPFVLAAALEQDIPLGSLYQAPATIEIETPEGPYEVGNYGGQEFGTVDLNAATADSVNTVYAQLAQDVGPGKVVSLAERAGITSEMQPNASLVLGTNEVSVLDLADSYLTFARDGERVEPWAIARIEDADGDVLLEHGPPAVDPAIDQGAARAVTHALRGVIEDGTGTAAAIDRPAAGKTGTTQGNGDAWFAGYTPDYVATVWMGYPEGPSRPMTDVHGGPVTGGGLSAEIWRVFMEQAVSDLEPRDFEPPPDELLRSPEPPSGELVVDPGTVEPGDTISVTGSGFEDCEASWWVSLDPAGAQSSAEEGSDSDERSAELQVPDDAAPGAATVTAWCDVGIGPNEAGSATVEILGPPTTTTTSTTEAPEEEDDGGDEGVTDEVPDATLPETEITEAPSNGNNGIGNGNGKDEEDD